MALRYIYDRPDLVANCVAMMLPHVRGRGFGKCSAIGVIDEEGKLISGLVFHNFNPEAGIIEISGAATSPRWLTRETIRRFYQYPFHQLGCQMVVQQTPIENERLLRQLARYGYHFVKVPRMFGRDKDGVLCCLTYEAWAENDFNRRFKHHIRPGQLEEAA